MLDAYRRREAQAKYEMHVKHSRVIWVSNKWAYIIYEHLRRQEQSIDSFTLRKISEDTLFLRYSCNMKSVRNAIIEAMPFTGQPLNIKPLLFIYQGDIINEMARIDATKIHVNEMSIP